MEHHSDEAESTPKTELELEDSAASLITPTVSDASQLPSPTSVLTFDETRARAGFWLRFVAFTIDTVILGVFALALFLVGLVVTTRGEGLQNFTVEAEERMLFFPLWISALLTASAAYFTILHSEYGQTIGKNLLSLEVRTCDGALLSYSQALFRWLAYGVSIFPCGLGFLWVALNPGKRGWHDVLANTMVVTPKHLEQ